MTAEQRGCEERSVNEEGKRWEDGRREWGEVPLYIVVGWDCLVTSDL